jgi:hypothetical protein
MHSFLRLMIAAALAVGGVTAASLVLPISDGPAFAAKAKRSKTQRSFVPQTTGFEHQQCSVQNPCSTRNTH